MKKEKKRRKKETEGGGGGEGGVRESTMREVRPMIGPQLLSKRGS